MRIGLLVPVLLALALPMRAQTLDEVRQAVNGYFGDDAVTQASHAALERWGNAALPFLRELAGKPDDAGLLDRMLPVRQGDWELVCSIRELDTPEAIEFLVEILDGKTAVAAPQALDSLQNMSGAGRALSSHLRFQQLVFKFAKDDSGWLGGHSRGVAARIIADCHWEDGEPLLELMLQDDDLRIREDGAQALARLTGRHVEIRRPALAFPHAADRDELGLVATARRSGDPRGRLETWFDGKPALLVGSGTNLEAQDGFGTVREILDPGFDVADVLSLPRPDQELHWVFLADETDQGFASDPAFAVGVDAERHELWRYTPGRSGIETMCRLYDDAGCIGVAFGPGGDEGVVAFDPDGHELFRVPGTHVTYEISSHPRVPRLWLHCGGDLLVYDNQGKPAGESTPGRWRSDPSGGRLYASNAVLAADTNGQPVIVASGSGIGSLPTIVCCDVDRHEAWRATVPHRVTALALLEPPDGPALMAATTAGGELLVFDLDGGLHQRLAMPHANRIERNGDVSAYSISAGPLPEGSYGLAVGLLSTTLVYTVR